MEELEGGLQSELCRRRYCNFFNRCEEAPDLKEGKAKKLEVHLHGMVLRRWEKYPGMRCNCCSKARSTQEPPIDNIQTE